MTLKESCFITIEGGEGVGKSSFIVKLKKYLEEKNLQIELTREPGGTKVGELLRKIILNNQYKITNLEEILLLMSARLNHINNVILPSLNKGKIVISDRFADSTFVYQGFVNKFGIKKTQMLHKILLNNFLPNKTFLFELSTKKIIERLKKRRNKNKYDKLNIDFHQKVNAGYRKISKSNRFIRINASLSKEIIHKKIIKHLNLIL